MPGYLESLMNPAANGALSGDGGFFSDPRNVGLLSMAAGLLQAGGPQRFPTSTGQALAQGLQAGLGGFTQTQHANLNNQMLQAHAALFQQQARKGALENELASQMLAGGGLGNFNDPDQMEKWAMRYAAFTLLPRSIQNGGFLSVRSSTQCFIACRT